MSKWFGKKQVLLSTLVVALGAAVYLNYYFASVNPPPADPAGDTTLSTTGKHLGDSQYVDAPATDGNTTKASVGYFSTARQTRELARVEALEILQDTLQDVKISEELQQETLTKVQTMSEAIEQENTIESLILAKGFADCVTYIDGESCHVVVQGEQLDAAQTIQIMEIVTTHSSVSAENINIEAVNS